MKKENKDTWRNSLLQFSALLSKIDDIGLSGDQWDCLIDKMDLDNKDLVHLFNRAERLMELQYFDDTIKMRCPMPECYENVFKVLEKMEDGSFWVECTECEEKFNIDRNGILDIEHHSMDAKEEEENKKEKLAFFDISNN